MTSNLGLALLITLIGMGLVFSAILLLWGLMALLVRLTPERAAPGAAGEPEPGSEQDARVDLPVDDLDLLRQAAAVAVAMALTDYEESMQLHEFPLPPTASVSPWQAVMRSKMLNKRGSTR